ncbi:SPOR domain-containing protein [Rhizobiales bacterium RZME27]|uniref:SPOR domain-containing protein n=1 Tax=Endobacterium cereale TaxID=2663029 RepID=A0A6A8AJS6_9HYPH|nr:SPOR domain-containing protein [Endobacterium cereale]MEB2843765.1 SPOR domain-containing protein [Endobacterium cereale]MQY49416.1 SPOR domain-containing protein [Endobacterium cereale]
MADNNLALGRHDGPDIFAENDPLAELARIVGYEDRSARPSAQAAAPRREPEFNLEDELMREFERYDAPRLDPANDIGAVGAPVQARQPVEVPFMDAPRPVPVERAEPSFEQPSYPQSVEPAPPLQHLPFDLAAGAPAMPIHQKPPFSHADLVAELESSLAPASQAQFEPAEQSEAQSPLQPIEPVQQPAPFVAEVAVTAEPLARTVEKGYKPGFRMPIANFQRVDTPSRESYRPSPVEPAQVALPVEPIAVSRPAEPVRQAPEVIPAESPAPILAESNESIWSSLERELTGEEFEPVENKPIALPVEQARIDLPVFEMPKPISAEARVEPVRPQPLAVDHARTENAEKPAASFSPLGEIVHDADHFSAQKPAAVIAAPSATDADLIDDDFELALEDLDLDFSEMSPVDDKPAPVTVAPVLVDPAPAAPSQATRQPEPAYQPAAMAVSQAASYTAATSYAPTAAVAPIAVAAVNEPVVAEFDNDQFDPTLIADGDEQVESMVEVEVPELPAEEPVTAPKHDPDFDIDLDAELANLLHSSAPAAPSLARGSAAAVQNVHARQPMPRATPTTAPVAAPQPVAVAPAKSAYDADLDDFERALEEDFRRSLSSPLPDSGRTRDEQDDGYAEPVARRQMRWAAPAAIAGVLLLGGLSAYAFYASGVPGKADGGAPLVIAADKEPVKVAPENPGGKTVPNQDKAVYERVAGGANDAPRQETLISSNEEPMDVVQRTLTSDNLPLQGEEEAMAENLDTQDPRLLPQQANGAPQGEQPVSVMPRKVRTMVVRPDGTLVEQEVSAPAAPVQQAAIPQKLPAQPALAEPTVAPKTSHVAPAQPAPMSAPATPAAPAQVVTASAPVAAPARPVPASRPVDQPVNVVASVSDRGNVQQAAASQQTTASVGPGGYFIQVASLPSQAEAQKSYQNLSSKFGNVIGGRGVDIKAAEIAGKGTFYRVRIPAGSKDQAVQLCENYRSAGGSCLVAR